MQASLFFEQDQTERLFLTYHRNPSNYQKIKNKIAGEQALTAWKRSQRGGWLFIAAVTFIAAITSLFAVGMEQYPIIISVWSIWAMALIVFLAITAWRYATSHRTLQKNELFFQAFEQIATTSASLEEFRVNWQIQQLSNK